jgi:hypothetical protein
MRTYIHIQPPMAYCRYVASANTSPEMSKSERSDAESQKKRCESVNTRVTELRENNQIRRKQKNKKKTKKGAS